MPGPVRLYAHRGAAHEAPENTMPSFARALEVGANALEMDVHATRDGVIVVSHDPDGGRMTGVARPFREVDWEEVKTWDAGWGFLAPDGSRPFAGRRIAIPRLEQVLAEFPSIPLNIDLKAPIADPVVRLIRAADAESRVCLASFQRSTIAAVRALGYRGPTALSRTEVAQLLALPLLLQRGPCKPAGTAAQLPLSLARPWVVARCRALGLRVDYWTVNDEATAARLLALGVDGIMTDDPARIAPVLAARSRDRATA